MEVFGLDRPASTVLLLGAVEEHISKLREHFARFGFLLDHAEDRDATFQLFLDRGGHDLVLFIGEPGEELHQTLASLREIQPGLRTLCVPELPDAGFLAGLEERMRQGLGGMAWEKE